MKLRNFLFSGLFCIVLLPACGVKSAPLPPLTELQEKELEAKQKEKDEKEARKQARIKQQQERQEQQKKNNE